MIGTLLQTDLEEIIRRKDWVELRAALSELDPPDIAEIIVDLPQEDEGVIFRVLPREVASAAFSYLPLENQEELVRSLSGEQTQALVAEMTPDDRARLLEELPAPVCRRLLESLTPDELKATRDLLGYPPGTAGRYMTPEYVALPEDVTARHALQLVKKTGRGKETLNVLYIVDGNGKLIEDVRLGSLVLADDEVKVSDIEDRPLVSIPAMATGEEVVAAFEKYDRVALPVVDGDGRMLGIITVDDVLDFAEKKATAEMQKLGGSEALDGAYFEVGFWQMIKKRGGWLAALFLGETLTATAMGKYEHAIEKAAVLALFVPLIISSGGNSGSQATSILIRSLALQDVKLRDWWRVFGRELGTSCTLGVILGAIGFFRICLWHWMGWQDYEGHAYLMATTVWVSLVGVVMFGSLVGSMLPFLLRRLGFDPATASAPFVATLVDVTGLIIYFTVASMILRGTLL
ncbi:magnesium transporter [Humisphaera borealis]|uniref:Magnesium transporter MgtE n=1 Tax=Humisphaera borealis TaxID=2807512 RepID=A0A7M2WVW9_9BACT|nr:magnesium transporter [Humisphaera borealis]QOV89529.1 magnesium transporter [Humisphaera borealis]